MRHRERTPERIFRFPLLVCALAVFLLLPTGPGRAEGEGEGGIGTLLYASNGLPFRGPYNFGSMNVQWDVFVRDLPDGPPRNLTDHPAYDGQPAWSPDGQRIAFVSTRDGTRDLYVMDVDGGNVTRLTEGAGRNVEPCWSPGGDTIVFSSDREGSWDLFTLDVERGRTTRLTDDPADEMDPACSPDGGTILFVSNRGDQNQIFSMGARGGSATCISADAGHRRSHRPTGTQEAPVWTADGRKVLFAASDNCSDVSIFRMNPDGSGSEPMVDPDLHGGNALRRCGMYLDDGALSPDGQWLAFCGQFGSLYLMQQGGGGFREIQPERAANVSWKPDPSVRPASGGSRSDPAPGPSTGPYVVRGREFHRPDCRRIQRLRDPETLPDREACEGAGLRPCRTCDP